VPVDDSHKQIDPTTGQQKGYVVLTAEERAKGFVKPVRGIVYPQGLRLPDEYGTALAETYARNPWFLQRHVCCACGAHFDLNQFHWKTASRWTQASRTAGQRKWLSETAQGCGTRAIERAELARLKSKYERGEPSWDGGDND